MRLAKGGNHYIYGWGGLKFLCVAGTKIFLHNLHIKYVAYLEHKLFISPIFGQNYLLFKHFNPTPSKSNSRPLNRLRVCTG